MKYIFLLILSVSPVLASSECDVIGRLSKEGRTTAVLFEEASRYVEKKFAEFSSKGLAFDPNLVQQTEREQRELASRYATELSSCKELEGPDLYYYGMLLHIARDTDRSVRALREFLSKNSPPDELQRQSRLLLVDYGIKKNGLDEAERELNNLKNRSNSGDKDLVFLQIRLADAFKKNKELQKAVHHASQSYTGAKALQKERSMQQMEVDKLLLITNFVLTDAYLEMKDRKRATETSTDLIELALSIPSANLYSAALDRFSNLTELNLDPSKLNIVPDRTAPDLQISKWLDPKSTTLNDMKGKVVLLEFWATWCKPCLASFPVLRRWQDRYKNKGFAILGLTRYYGSERWPKMEPEQELRFLRTFRNTHKLTFPIAVSDSVDNELNYSVRGIPTSILIDRRGRVRFMAIGSGPDDQSMIESMIEKLLNEKN